MGYYAAGDPGFFDVISDIGKAVGGVVKGVGQVVAPIVGGIFGGPAGAAVGSAVGGFLGGSEITSGGGTFTAPTGGAAYQDMMTGTVPPISIGQDRFGIGNVLAAAMMGGLPQPGYSYRPSVMQTDPSFDYPDAYESDDYYDEEG
jgi:hypothetical protein